jgi:hypothetical protein
MFHYNSAIRALVADKPPVEIVLAACVIFWTLENFHGSDAAAFEHMNAAVKILGEWKDKRRPNDPAQDFIMKYIEPTIVDGIKFASKSRIESLAEQMSDLSLTTRDMRIMNMNHPAFDNLDDAEVYLGDRISKILALKSRTHTQAWSDSAWAKVIEEIEQIDAELYKWMHLFQNIAAIGSIFVRRMLIIHNVAAYVLLDQLKAEAKYKTGTNQYETPAGQEDDHDPHASAGRSRHNFIVMELEDLVRDDALATTEIRRREPRRLGLIAPAFLAAISAKKLENRRRAINVLRLLKTIEGPWRSEHATEIAEAMLHITPVQWQHVNFDFSEPKQTLTLEYDPEATAGTASQRRAVTRPIDASGMAWTSSVSISSPRPAPALH